MYKFQAVEQILMAHFYTGESPYVYSVRRNAPDTKMSGAFCVTMFRARDCIPLAPRKQLST